MEYLLQHKLLETLSTLGKAQVTSPTEDTLITLFDHWMTRSITISYF